MELPQTSSCQLHPGIAVTGFCAACLCERLGGLDAKSSSNSTSHCSDRKSTSALKSFFSKSSVAAPAPAPAPPTSSSAQQQQHQHQQELRRCKSFSYGRGVAHQEAPSCSSSSYFAGTFEPQRRSCGGGGGGQSTLHSLFHLDENENMNRSASYHDPFLPSSSYTAGDIELDLSCPNYHQAFHPPCVPEDREEEEDDDDNYQAIREVLGRTIFEEKPMKEHIKLESKRPPPKDFARNIWVAASGFSKKWQDWRRKQKVKKEQQKHDQRSSKAAAAAMPLGKKPSSKSRRGRHRDTQSEMAVDALSRRSCDTDPRFSIDAARMSFDVPRYSLDERRVSWDGYLVGGCSRSVHSRLPPMLSVVEDVPRSDGQIPVEEDAAIPGGSDQTRDYYLDSSSRRRRSLERSASARKSCSDASEPKQIANASVSPAGGTEFYHYHHGGSILDHNSRDFRMNSMRDDTSESFRSAFRDQSRGESKKKSKRWIKGWNIWGLMHNKDRSKEGDNAVERSLSESWPELRARGYNGQMLRCNSNASARSSFSATGVMGSARRSSVEMNGHAHGKKRRDEFALERNRSARYSPSRGDNGMLRFYLTPTGTGQITRRNGVSGKGRLIGSNSLSRSSFRLY